MQQTTAIYQAVLAQCSVTGPLAIVMQDTLLAETSWDLPN